MLKPEKGETRPALVYVPTSMATIAALTGKPLAEFMPSFPQPQPLTLKGEGQQLMARTPKEAGKLLAEVFGIDMTGMQFQGASDLQSFPDRGIKQKSYTWSTIPPKVTEGKPGYDYRQMRFVHLTTITGTGQVISYNYQDVRARPKGYCFQRSRSGHGGEVSAKNTYKQVFTGKTMTRANN